METSDPKPQVLELKCSECARAIHIDGVYLRQDQCVVIALGIDETGNKQALDFEPGSSESLETVMRLLSRLLERGVKSSTAQRWLKSNPRRGGKSLA